MPNETILLTIKAVKRAAYAARYAHAVKTQGSYTRHIWQDMREYFAGDQDAFGFIDSMVAEIDNQLTRAWNEGARNVGVDPRDMTDPDLAILQDKIMGEREFILGLAEDIEQARADGMTPQEFSARFKQRADLWANRYTETVNEAEMYFGGKEKLEWVLGETEQHCETCSKLSGVVAYAEEWYNSRYSPQNPPNEALACGGWQCDCELRPTDRRRTRGGIPE